MRFWIVVAAGLAGCFEPTGHRPCVSSSECEAGEQCLASTCLDRTPPRLVEVSPGPFEVWVGTPLRFTFDEAITLGPGAVRVTPSFSIEARAADVTLEPDGRTIVVRPTDVRVPEELQVGFTNTLTDLAGNPYGSAQTSPFDYPAWPRQDVRRVDVDEEASRVSVVLDGGTRPLLSWLEGGFAARLYLRFVDADPASPTPLNRDAEQPITAGPSLVAGAGVADLLWVEGYNGTLAGTRFEGATTTALATGLSGSFSELSVARDSTGALVAAFGLGNDLVAGRFVGTQWTPLGTRVGLDDAQHLSPRLAIASDDAPHVATVRVGATDDLLVLRWDGAAWQRVGDARLNTAGTGFTTPALAADGDALRLAWVENGSLVTRRWNGAAWSAPVVVATGLSSDAQVDLHVEPNGTAWLVWSDSLRRILAARTVGEGWETTVSMNPLGPFSSGFSSAVGDGIGPYVAWTDDEGRIHLARFNRQRASDSSPPKHTGPADPKIHRPGTVSRDRDPTRP